jgi:hypothetical protein
MAKPKARVRRAWGRPLSEALCSSLGQGVQWVRLRLTYLGSYCRRRRSRSGKHLFRNARYSPGRRSLRFASFKRPPGGKRISRLKAQLLRSLQIRRAGTAFNGVGCGELPGR